MNISGLSTQLSNAIFTKLDTNNQGYIDKSTFASALGGDDNSETAQAFNALDGDSDGQLTKSELSKGIENLLNELNSASAQNQSQASRSAPPEGAPPPPPPNQNGGDEGLTKEEMTSMASETTDTKMAGMLSQVASNFEAADTNQDGKVTLQESLAYQKSQAEKSTAAGTSTQNEGATHNNSNHNAEAGMKKVAQLLANYLEQMAEPTNKSPATNSISTTA